MPGIALSSLRVAVDGDSSGYAKAMQAKVQADQAAIASGDSLGQSLARTDAAQDKLAPGVVRLSRSLIDGYSAASGFEKSVRAIGNALDRGLGLDRATQLIAGAYEKFNLFSDGAAFAAKGQTSLAAAIDTVNQRLSLQAEIADRANQAVQKTATAQSSQANINSQLGINTAPGANTASRGADIASYGKALDDLRAKYNPLYAAGQQYRSTLDEINQAARVGAISESERAAAIDRTKTSFAAQITAMNATKGANDNLGQSVGAASGHIQSLEAVVRHVADSIAAGTPPLQAFGREIGNLSYGLSGGALKSISDTITGLLTPVRLATGALGGIGLGAAAAAISWQSSQREIELALAGIGRAAGASASDVNKIAEAHSSVATISISEARQVALALAETGKVSASTFGPILDVTKNFATTLNLSIGEAGKTLAGAFADPVKGADELDRKLGFLSDATKTLISNLAASGDRVGAQKALLDAMSPSLSKATDLTSGWGKAWTTVANAASNAFTAIGKGISEVLSGPSDIDQQIQQAEARLAAAQGRQAGTRPGTPGTLGNAPYARASADVATYTAALEGLRAKQAQIASQAADTKMNDFSKQVADVMSAAVPASKATDELADRVKLLNQAMAMPELAAYVSHIDDLPLALQREAEAMRTTLDPIDRATKSLELQAAALDHRSISDRVSQAVAAKSLELDGQKIAASERQAQLDLVAKVAGGGQTAADQQQIARINALGSLATVLDKVNAKRLELNNTDREGLGLTTSQKDALVRLTEAEEVASRTSAKSSAGIADTSDITRTLNLQRSSLIDRGLLDPSDAGKMRDANVALAKSFEAMSNSAKEARAPLSALQKLEDDAGSLRGQLDSTAVSSLNSLTSSLADITTGSKKAGDAFSALGPIVVRSIEEMLIKMIVLAPIAKALQASLGAFLPGFGGGTPTAGEARPDLTGGFHSGGLTSEPTFMRYVHPGTFNLAPRFHSGIGPDEMPAILQKGEGVFTARQMAAMAPVGAGGGGGGNRTEVNIHNASGGQVKATKSRRGNVDVTDIIIGTVGNGIATGRFDGANRARYGSAIKPISR